MMTQTHLIFGLAAFGRPQNAKVTTAALIGSFIPDLSLYAMAGWHLRVLGTSPNVVFNELYFSEAWHSIFRIDNSIILWGIALGLAIMAKSKIAIALCGAAMLHLALDFPLHHDDGRAHFWPITSWIFESPVSYWDRNHFGHVVSPIEILVSLVACVYAFRKWVGIEMRVFIGLLAALQCLALFGSIFMMIT